MRGHRGAEGPSWRALFRLKCDGKLPEGSEAVEMKNGLSTRVCWGDRRGGAWIPAELAFLAFQSQRPSSQTPHGIADSTGLPVLLCPPDLSPVEGLLRESLTLFLQDLAPLLALEWGSPEGKEEPEFLWVREGSPAPTQSRGRTQATLPRGHLQGRQGRSLQKAFQAPLYLASYGATCLGPQVLCPSFPEPPNL